MIGLQLIGECILCFACTFRDINTTDGITDELHRNFAEIAGET